MARGKRSERMTPRKTLSRKSVWYVVDRLGGVGRTHSSRAEAEAELRSAEDRDEKGLDNLDAGGPYQLANESIEFYRPAGHTGTELK